MLTKTSKIYQVDGKHEKERGAQDALGFQTFLTRLISEVFVTETL